MSTSTSSSTTRANWLRSASTRLKQAGVSSYRLDALILLEDELGLTRAKLLSDEHIELRSDELKHLEASLKRRLNHEPIAYIRQKIEFYGRDFLTLAGVFIPRVESESFIEIMKKLDLAKDAKVADVGTGSGCIGITAKLEFPDLRVDLIDKSQLALSLAKKNAELHKVVVNFINSDLLSRGVNYDLIIANLPYVPFGEATGPDIKHEPIDAIFAGDNGLSMYHQLFTQLGLSSTHSKFVLVEALENQHTQLIDMAKEFGYHLAYKDGLVLAFSRQME